MLSHLPPAAMLPTFCTRVTPTAPPQAGCGGCVSMMWSERKGIAGVVRCPPTAALSAGRRCCSFVFAPSQRRCDARENAKEFTVKSCVARRLHAVKKGNDERCCMRFACLEPRRRNQLPVRFNNRTPCPPTAFCPPLAPHPRLHRRPFLTTCNPEFSLGVPKTPSVHHALLSSFGATASLRPPFLSTTT
jgi:hypothetical protein